jgi:hypothetical protein
MYIIAPSTMTESKRVGIRQVSSLNADEVGGEAPVHILNFVCTIGCGCYTKLLFISLVDSTGYTLLTIVIQRTVVLDVVIIVYDREVRGFIAERLVLL